MAIRIKKELCILTVILLLSSFVLSQDYQIDVSTDKQSYLPGDEVNFKVLLKDSGNNFLNEKVNIKVSDADKKTILEKTVDANKFSSFTLEKNSTRGWWGISASYGGIEVEPRLFSVDANEEAEFQLQQNILIIRNTGNVPYQKPVQVIIGSKTEIINPYLEINGKTDYKLLAPDGVYNVKVTDGEKTIMQNDLQLTGDIISIASTEDIESSPITAGRGYSENESSLERYRIAWIFVAVIFALFVLMLIQNFIKNKRR